MEFHERNLDIYSGALGLALLIKEGFALAWWALSENWKRRERKRKALIELYRFRSWNSKFTQRRPRPAPEGDAIALRDVPTSGGWPQGAWETV